MRFDKGKTKEYYLLTTDVENVYINEYMPDAPGDFVKAYLYGLFCAEHEIDVSLKIMAGALKLSEDRLREALGYWEGIGAIETYSEEGEFSVRFNSLREKLYSAGADRGGYTETAITEAEDEEEEARKFRELIDYAETLIGRPLNAKELQEINSWDSDLGATEELIRTAFDYCAERGKTGINYVSKVVLGWTSRGLRTQKEIGEYLESVSERQGIYRRILNSLGITRNITEAESRMVDKWIDEMHFSMERIMEACEKASFNPSPNLRYVNKVLENWKQEADDMGRDVNQRVTVNQATLNKYYEYLRNQAEENAEERRQEVYNKIPEIRQIDMNLQQLSSKISRGLLGGSTKQEIDNIKKDMRNLEKERAIILTENNFSLDYTDIKYLCSRCSDTGIDENGQRCSCVKSRMGEAELWQNGKLK